MTARLHSPDSPPASPPAAGTGKLPAPPIPTTYAGFLSTLTHEPKKEEHDESIRRATAKAKAEALKRERHVIAALVLKLDGALPPEFRNTLVRNHAGRRSLGIRY
jgi:hypothetical protein